MSDPQRWLDAADAPDGASSLLRAAASSKPLQAAVKARSAARLAELATTTAVATAAPATAVFSLWTKLFVGLCAIALVGAAVTVRRAPSAPPRPPIAAVAPPRVARTSAAPREEAPAPATPPIVVVPAARPSRPAEPPRAARVVAQPVAPPAPPAVAAPAPVALPTPTAEPLAGGFVAAASPSPAGPAPLLVETQSLADVSRALDHDPAEAQRLLSEYRARFPRSRLAPERDYLAFEIARRQGHDDEARALGEAFVRSHPRAPQAAAVRARIAP